MKNITKEEYQKMLDEHDWYYMMSNNRQTYNNGINNERKLLNLTINNPLFDQMYKDKLKTIKL